MLAMTIIDDPELTQLEVSDDGVLHELVHLASGVDICTHTGMSDLRLHVSELQELCNSIKESNGTEN
jgi:hypothetical protein